MALSAAAPAFLASHHASVALVVVLRMCTMRRASAAMLMCIPSGLGRMPVTMFGWNGAAVAAVKAVCISK